MSTVKYVADIPRSIRNKKQARQAVWRQLICIPDADHDCIIDEIERRGHIDHERQIHNDDK